MTHRMLPSASLAARGTLVRGRDGDKMGYAPGVCDRREDLITATMERMAWRSAM
jgi:hypothetical protein